MRVHVMFSKRRGTDGFAAIVEGNDGHRDSIDMHSRPDMIEPAVDGTPRIEMSPLAEVPLRNQWRELWAVSKRANLHSRHPVSLTLRSTAG